MLLPLEQFCSSRVEHKVVHAVVRLTCVICGVLTVLLFESQRVFEIIRGTPVDDIAIYSYFFSPLIVIASAVFSSFWFARVPAELRALAIDWFFALAYVGVWCFEMVRIFQKGFGIL